MKITNEEIREFIKDGYFFNACCAVAINKGFSQVIRDKKICQFSIGDYNVKFNPEITAFELGHKIYFARIIHAHYSGVHFIGDNEQEVIDELLIEFDREVTNM